MLTNRRKYVFPVTALLFLIAVPLSAHLLWSWAGFSPTDEGFTLAYSRRLLDGQVPHRDFIIIRPALSPLLHAPLVALAGDRLFWWSRLVVWTQFAVIAWAWVIIIERRQPRPFGAGERFGLALLIFALNTHHFPPMAWHSIDALCLLSLGIALWDRSALAGAILVGLSPLARQNFALLALIIPFVLGDGSRLRVWIALLAPAAFYALYLLAYGALGDAAHQLTAQSGSLVESVSEIFVHRSTVLGLMLGYAAARLKRPAWIGIVLVTDVSIVLALALIADSWFYLYITTYLLFGAALGAGLVRRTCLFALILLTAWTVSISIGYHTPALAAGVLMAALLVEIARPARVWRWLLPGLLVVTLLAWTIGRQQHLYRESPAGELSYSLTGILPGGAGISTNANTYAFMLDLRAAIRAFPDRRYAIVPDVAAWWAASDQANPLPIDWPQSTELRDPDLQRRVIRAAERACDVVFLVETIDARDLADGFFPLPAGRSPLADYIRAHFVSLGTSAYFEFYASPVCAG